MSQNCYLKRLLAQYDVGGDLPPEAMAPIGNGTSVTTSAVALVPTSTVIAPANGTNTTTSSLSAVPKNASSGGGGKKRKMDPVTTIQATAVSDSSDEGLGSMSPEPFTILPIKAATKKQQAAAMAAELKAQQQTQQAVADMERSRRNGGDEVYTITEIVEPCVDFEIDIDSAAMEETVISSERTVPVSAAPLPKKKRITVESLESNGGELETASGMAVVNGQITKIFRDLSDMHGGQEIQELQVINSDSEIMLCSSLPGNTMSVGGDGKQPVTIIGKLGKNGKVTIIDGAMLDKKSKLQPLLESFNKVENKVEVERITSSPLTTVVVKEEAGKAILGASTSRQNLETIVEAIRHLEGDRFGEQPKNGRNGVVVKTEALTTLVAELPTQEVPLALTTKVATAPTTLAEKKAELSQFVHFKKVAAATGASGISSSSVSSAGGATTTGSAMGGKVMALTTTTTTAAAAAATTPTTIVVRQLQQCRPGVIVAKQSS